ncbi:MAG: hypothetical protein CVU15_01345 [Betaproteobacteria bacterium HGW-Betaproteobacteria-1]|jgi:hypothetical protein|nr:MAG: hypothetical protein CVU15_01345 [Betaproteobacteria bacterium HGW-Betaproteobacteria-1]
MKLWKPLVLGLMALLCMAGCAEKSLISIECPEISRGCTVEGLTVMTSQQPQILKPFELRVESDEAGLADITEVYASFAMEGMDMGLNRYRLIRKSEGLWVAEVTLPLCVRGRADWLMQLETKTRFGSKQYLLGFHTS